MMRKIESAIDLELDGEADLVFSIAAHTLASLESETFTITGDGQPLEVIESIDRSECRLHRVTTSARHIEMRYSATVLGRAQANEPEELDLIQFRRPSRYAESDLLGPTARSMFRGKQGFELVDAVVDWVSRNISYVPGSSAPTDGARDTFLKRQGVCRDFAHLTIAFLRANDLPARLVSVYAPGLVPMDFHAVVEVLVDGAWYVVDATHLAPRRLMQRIASGRDAADTAFLSNTIANLRLSKLHVNATSSEVILEDWTERVQLG
ncbi:transglutaminase [Pseudoclavibacter sp. RFBB5]|nr:transglutaminase [Pseudoclavibacter sp. RFBB5]